MVLSVNVFTHIMDNIYVAKRCAVSDVVCMFTDSAKEQHTKTVSEHSESKSRKRKKQSDDVKPCTDKVLKKQKTKKVMCSISQFRFIDVISFEILFLNVFFIFLFLECFL